MKTTASILTLAASCAALSAGAADLAALQSNDVATILWHGEDGTTFWNGHSERFIYPPAFAFTNRADAARYRFTVTDHALNQHVFDAGSATASLAPVWAELPCEGFVRADCHALAADGSVLGPVGSRRFWKATPFEPGAYPPAARSYDEAAARAFAHTLDRHPALRTFVKTGRPDRTFIFSSYPSKMDSALVLGMVQFATLRPDRRDDALKLARTAADYLISVMQPADAPLAFFTPTYEAQENSPAAAKSYLGQNMLVYPAEVGRAFTALAGATGDDRYLDAAKKIASTYARLQGEDGTWYLKMWEKDGQPVAPNRLVPFEVIDFMETLHDATGEEAWRTVADRAFAYVERGPLTSWNWEGQFEDVAPSKPYHNLTMYGPCSTALYLLKRFPGDARRLAQARDLLRLAEDQFVMWRRPCYADGRGWRAPYAAPNPKTMQTDYLSWKWQPCVTEQYAWYLPVDASAGKLIETYLALYGATGNALDLAKARALGDAITRVQREDGSIPTQWAEYSVTHDADWLNCHLAAARALQALARVAAP